MDDKRLGDVINILFFVSLFYNTSTPGRFNVDVNVDVVLPSQRTAFVISRFILKLNGRTAIKNLKKVNYTILYIVGNKQTFIR